MAISKIRDYIVSSIASVDSKLKKWDSPFDADDIPETCANNAYSIKYDLSTSENGQQTVEDIVEAEISFLFKGFRDEADVYDNSMDLVNTIRLKLLSKTNIQAFINTDDNPIATVTSNSITGSSIDNNKRQVLITLSVSFLIYQTIC